MMWISTWLKWSINLSSYALDNNFSTSSVGKSQPKNMYVSLNMKPSRLVTDKIFCLLVILMDDAIKHMCIWPLSWHNMYKPYNPLTLLQQFLTLLFASQKGREAMKDERNHYGAMDKSLSEQQVCVSMSMFCTGRKNWLYPPTASGSYSRQAVRRNVGGFQNS